MKKFKFSILLALFFSALIIACSGNKEEADEEETDLSQYEAKSSKPSGAVNEEGKKLYQLYCASCHIPDKKLIGPPMKGALELWGGKKDDLYLWTRNPQEAVDKKIPRALEIQDFDPSAMTGVPNLTDEQLDDIYEYIEQY